MTLARFAWRQVWRGATIWAAVVAIVALSGIEAFKSAYSNELAREAFARSVAKLPSFQALYGRATGVDTTGGFLTWRYGDTLTVVVGLWALLAVTRVLRGDEETGRAEVLVAGSVPPRRLLLVELGAVGGGCALIMVVAALACLAGGLPIGGAILFGFMVAAGGLVFGAVGALTSQLFDGRRRAAGWAGVVLGASYLLRALADGSSKLHGLAWITPLGWTERIEPFNGANLVPVALVIVASVILVGLGVFLREKRDTGAGLIGARSGRGRPRLMRSTFALDWHLSTVALIAWAAGIFVTLFVLGYLTHDMVRFANDNPTITADLNRIYGYSIASPTGFLSVSFGIVALLLAVYAGSHMLSAREEEAEGRTDTLVIAGTSRAAWLGARITIALIAMALLAVVAAFGAWLGANTSGASVTFVHALEASVNVIPAALLFGGLSVLAFGAAPRITSYVAFGAVALAYLIQIIGGLSKAPHWLTKVSPFTHLAPVPATSVNIGATVVMLAIALVTAGGGMLAFVHRDLASD
jgi:ABC-2 type transport system permease protein